MRASNSSSRNGRCSASPLTRVILLASAGSRASRERAPASIASLWSSATTSHPGRADELGCDQPRSGGHIEYALAEAWCDRLHHRAAPAWILAERERGAYAVVCARETLKELQRMVLTQRCRFFDGSCQRTVKATRCRGRRCQRVVPALRSGGTSAHRSPPRLYRKNLGQLPGPEAFAAGEVS